jgi:hypothetical protein
VWHLAADRHTTGTITWTATNGLTGSANRAQTSAPLNVYVGEWQAVRFAGDPLR